MIILTEYGERVVDKINMLGMWLAVVVSIRNYLICYAQYRRTRGKIHLVNIGQVLVLLIHRFLYGIIPLFEITTCAYFPLLVSVWHIQYILFYTVMFMRLIILESDRHSLWIKIVGILLITVRFADWPYELAFGTLQQNLMNQRIQSGATCWAQWGNGVIIMNFVADALANLFLSGMFVRRLYLHIRLSNSVMSRQNRLIEYIARKSLVCLIFTFVVNLAMNLLKVTTFLGDRSDAFTVYFQIIESTLLVEALRVDYTRVPNQAFCENCGMEIHLPLTASKSIKNSSGRNGGGRRRVGGGRHHYHPEERQSYSLPTPVETEDSIMRAVSVFEATTSQPHIRTAALRDDEKRETTSAPVVINDKRASFSSRRTSCPLSPPSPTSPTSPTQPPNAMTTDTNNVGPVPASPTASRRPLSHHPEWSNNDYRMF